jgi:glycerol-3-phosphate acyltransferase PlsY
VLRKLKNFMTYLSQRQFGTKALLIFFGILVVSYCLNWLDTALGSSGVLADGILEGRHWFCGAYLVGSIPFAVLIPRIFRKIDPRTVGSKNPGTTNVYRSSGLVCAICVATSDVLKGMIPVYLALYLIDDVGHIAAACVGFGCVVGHIWPIFLSGEGGKGVATSAGVLFPFMPWTIVAAAVTWIIVAKCTKYAVLATGACVLIAVVGSFLSATYSSYLLFPLVNVLGGLITFKHRENILRFIQGKESKVIKIK